MYTVHHIAGKQCTRAYTHTPPRTGRGLESQNRGLELEFRFYYLLRGACSAILSAVLFMCLFIIDGSEGCGYCRFKVDYASKPVTLVCN